MNRMETMRVIYNDFPDLWDKIEEMDSRAFNQFKQNYSVSSLKDKFNKENEDHN